MSKRLLAIVAALLLFAAACGDDDASPTATTQPPAGLDSGNSADDDGDEAAPAGDEVIIDVTMAFEPATVEVAAGTTVTWVSAGGLPHTITSTGGPMEFDESLPDGGRVSITFDEPGTYSYACSIHPSMTGEIVVS
jgi:plastocyanin